jgi:hypothetical protein
MDRASIKNLLRSLTRKYGVRLYFNKKTESLGQARFWNRSISVCSEQGPCEMVSVFFHEIGHIHCHDSRKWVGYHNDTPVCNMSQVEKRLIVMTAVRAERWIDRWAMAEMAMHFPEMPYTSNYDCPDTRKAFLQELKREICID